MTENADIVRDFISSWSTLDADALASYFTADGIYHNMPAQPVSGHENLRKFIGGFISAWSSTEWEILNIVSVGDIVIAERVDKIVASGKHVALPCCGVFEMRAGKIAIWRDYFDMQTYQKAMS